MGTDGALRSVPSWCPGVEMEQRNSTDRPYKGPSVPSVPFPPTPSVLGRMEQTGNPGPFRLLFRLHEGASTSFTTRNSPRPSDSKRGSCRT